MAVPQVGGKLGASQKDFPMSTPIQSVPLYLWSQNQSGSLSAHSTPAESPSTGTSYLEAVSLPVDFGRIMEQRGYAACRCVDLDLVERRKQISAAGGKINSVTARPASGTAAPGSLEEQIDWISAEYHDFLSTEVPLLSYLLGRIVDRHAVHYPELWEFQGAFAELEEQLTAHLELEQRVLFPLLKRFDGAQESKIPVEERPNVSSTLASVWRNHDFFRDAMRNLRSWTHDFAPPDTACTVYRSVLQGMAELGCRLEACLRAEESLYAKVLALSVP